MQDNQSSSETITAIHLGSPYKVILFNDDFHTMEEVAAQIVKATGFPRSKAFRITVEADEKGRAIVWVGHFERAEHISQVLEEIRLGTKIEPA